jgi:hypothetical protein
MTKLIIKGKGRQEERKREKRNVWDLAKTEGETICFD